MLVMATIGVHAQFSISNSTQRRVIVAYELGSDGYYKRVTKKSVERVDNIVGSYAYDKKAQNLYVITPYSNLVITLTKDYAKIIKKNKSIPQVAEDDGRVSKTLNPSEKYNFTFWSSNVKYPTTANLRLDFSDKTVLELMKEKTYTGKEFAEFIKKK